MTKKSKSFKSFEKKQFWVVRCYKCGEEYCDDNDVLPVFKSKIKAENAIKNDDFWTVKNGKVYCGECK
jgi:hypothetical protein